jgi:hypothetical protein
MQSIAWAALLRHIPAEAHERLMVVTRGGTEIAIQSLLRIDHEFVAIKGRLAGTQDAGRVFFLAYDQIDYVGFQLPIRDSDFQQLFGGLVMPEPSAEMPVLQAGEPAVEEDTVFAAARAAAVATSDAEPPPEVATPAAAAAPAPAGSNTTNPVIKSAVLERFRARAQAGGGSGVRPPVKG